MASTPSCGPRLNEAWHRPALPALIEDLCTDPRHGLSPGEAERRLHDFGPNRLQASAGRPIWRVLLDQFTNVMLVMLFGVAVVSGLMDWFARAFPKDALAIGLIVVLNGLLGFQQESRAEAALTALRELAEPSVKVVRAGRPQPIPCADLVPGDVVLLEVGDRVPADLRLLDAVGLRVRESSLTGESEAVYKGSDLPVSPDAPLAERSNCLFQGTEVVHGRARGVVAATGMGTELGRIAKLIDSAQAEQTPLQQRLEQLANVLVAGSLAMVAVVVSVGWLLGQPLDELLEVCLSMAVAIVPEGLPAVITVTLAIGTQRMVRRAALIRRLPAVETLGCVTTICSDKTGTLTHNKQMVREIHTMDAGFGVSGDGYDPIGEIYPLSDSGDRPGPLPASLLRLLQVLALCNDAHLQRHGKAWIALGDPTEAALLTLAAKAQLDPEQLRQSYSRHAELPFSAERRRMDVLVDPTPDLAPIYQHLPPSRSAGPATKQALMLCKGAPESLLSHCRWSWGEAGLRPLDAKARQSLLARNQSLGQAGLRVLAAAVAPHRGPLLSDRDDRDLVWLGMVAQQDPPRQEVLDAVGLCQKAGIRVVMITGDQAATASAIATELGIAGCRSRVVEGRELEQLGDEALPDLLDQSRVFARVAPEHKLRLVRALQGQRQVVAMTGDGVNDAPALKQADIGVAMGISGTDVSKEAADMVLLDDNFTTIVSAVEEGRLVYANIRKFVKYILGSNVGELLTIASAPLLGLQGVPLTPLQILWMNLVTDGLPALALAMEPLDPSLMSRLPIAPGESIFARGLGRYILRVGVVFAAMTIVMMLLAAQASHPWKTMVFTTLCLAQMFHALSCRTELPLLQIKALSNPWLLWAVVSTTLLQLCLIYVASLRDFFGTDWLSITELGICFGFSALLFLYLEVEKLLRRRC